MRGLLALLLSPTLFAQVNFKTVPVPALPELPAGAGAAPSLAPLQGPALPEAGLAPLAAPGGIEAPLSPLEGSLEPALPSEVGSAASAASAKGAFSDESPAKISLDADAPASAVEAGYGLSAVYFDKAGKHGPSAEPVGAEDRPAVQAPAAAKGLHRFYPRVVFVMDVFQGKVPEPTVKLIDSFQQKGVQVVFLSQRPARGKGSVDEILTSRMKGRRDNALIVASEGGGKIYAHTSQAKNPKSLIEDHPAFSAKDLGVAFPRVLKALEAATHKNLLEKPEEVLVLGDPKKSPALVKFFPKGAYIHAVKDEASLGSAMRAVLGSESLETVSVERNKIRSYLEYLSSKAPREGWSGGGGGGDRTAARGEIARQLAFYKGVIIYDLMGRLYRDLRNGQYHLATPEQAEARLKSMWRFPGKNFVRVPKEVLKAMQTDAWKRHQGGAMMSAVGWLRNFYSRKFPNYPNGLLENVVQTIVNIASDGKSLISVQLSSPYTGRRYLVHVRPARVELHRGMHGPELIASAYRTGKEKPGEQDEVEAKLLALAMLRGYASRSGDAWLVNGQELRTIRVDFEYNTRTLSRTFQVSELSHLESDVTSLIERMEADTAFNKKYEKEKEDSRSKKQAAKKKSGSKAARGGK